MALLVLLLLVLLLMLLMVLLMVLLVCVVVDDADVDVGVVGMVDGLCLPWQRLQRGGRVFGI